MLYPLLNHFRKVLAFLITQKDNQPTTNDGNTLTKTISNTIQKTLQQEQIEKRLPNHSKSLHGTTTQHLSNV